jgi:bifunctional non-homologous end joining protein LigD
MVREHLPRFVPPMLARSGAPTDAEAWAYEVKFDGMRAQVRLERGQLCLRSRPGRDCTEAFPELVELSAGLRKRRVLLDGELVCLSDEGDPDFARLRARLRSTGREARLAARRAAATFLAFDLLHLDGRSTRELPYAVRRALLAELALDGPGWRTPRAFAAAEGASLLEATRERGLEGVVAKRLDAPYLPGVRSAAWMKHKHRRSENFVVTGWVPASGRQLEALLVARVGVEGRLAPAGSVSLGYHGELRARIQEVLRASELPPERPRQRLRRVAPSLRVTVDFHGPAGGPLRDPVLRAVAPTGCSG